MSERIQVHLRLFASLRQAAGWSGMTREVAADSTVGELLAELSQQFPALPNAAGAVYVAVNRTYAGQDTVLEEGDEVALFPPVSGGSVGVPLFQITAEPLSLDEVAARVAGPTRGAVTVFAGIVRGQTEASGGPGDDMLRTDHLEYEAYAEMAEPMLAQIGDEVRQRWPQVEAIAIVHRVGRLEVGEPSVVVAVASAHRQGTFEACSFAIERLKAVVPIWKKEVGSDGQWWVEGPGDTGGARPAMPRSTE